MRVKTKETKWPKTGSAYFSGSSHSIGAVSGTLHAQITTDNLSGKGGSDPSKSACTIVDEFNSNYDLRDHVDLGNVKKALSKQSVVKEISNATSPQKMLELLGLRGILVMADYNNLNATGFVKGHLLPQRLGGKGTDKNLTPMDRSVNARWERQFEKLVFSNLQAAKKVEKNSDYRIIIDYKVLLSGSMSPWFTNASSATKTVLSKLPSKIVGKATIAGFESKTGSKKAISAVEKNKFPKFDLKCSLDL